MNSTITATCGVALLFTAAGCGSGGGTVSGKVTYNDTPLTTGIVTFTDATGKAAAGTISLDGKYSVSNVPTGPLKVAVTSPGVPGPPPAPDPKNPSGGTVRPTTPLPRRYTNPDQSGLTFTATGETQTYDIKLTP